MNIEVLPIALSSIEHFRADFLRENRFQFVHDKCHRYGWADTYLFRLDGKDGGYGSVWGRNERKDRDTIFEFYLIPEFRNYSHQVFQEFISATSVKYLESQSNDKFMSPMFHAFSTCSYSEAILFEDALETTYHIPGSDFQSKEETGMRADERRFVMTHGDDVVASGGFLMNYNFPYADIYYDVLESQRRKGYGTLMVQLLKKEVYKLGRVPAARCNVGNIPSKATLLKGGFRICGTLMGGFVINN
jgi:RimJ/RimL family protein N-acetyltransferase